VDPRRSVSGDDVVEDLVRGGVLDIDPVGVAAVGQRPGARGVRADVIAQHHVAGGVPAGDVDADRTGLVGVEEVVPRDDVPGGGGRAANDIAGCAVDQHAEPVGYGAVTRDVGPDVIALDEVRRGRRPGDLDPDEVARDDVAVGGRGPPDHG